MYISPTCFVNLYFKLSTGISQSSVRASLSTILGRSHFVKLSNNPWKPVKGNPSLLYILLWHRHHQHIIISVIRSRSAKLEWIYPILTIHTFTTNIIIKTVHRDPLHCSKRNQLILSKCHSTVSLFWYIWSQITPSYNTLSPLYLQKLFQITIHLTLGEFAKKSCWPHFF